MPLLEAFLALALTMLSLAMIATLAVEFVHRLVRTRAKNLRTMLEEFYDSELSHFVESEVRKGSKDLEDKSEFIRKLLTNPLVSKAEQSGLIMSGLKDLTSLSSVDLFKRLAYTNLGKRIKARAEVDIDEAVDSLSRSYEAFEVAATDLFKRKAQLVSLVAGVVVAFGLNVNALSLFETYMKDPQARAKAVAQADVVLGVFERQTENIAEFKDEKELMAQVKSIRHGINELDNVGITIGYPPDRIPANWHKNPTRAWYLEAMRWALGVLGTGLLIGLGGPFWFNVVRKLTDVLQVVRGGSPTTAAAPAATANAVTDPMKSNKDAFKLAGGLPPLLKAQANLAAAAQAATNAGNTVKAVADALTETQHAAKGNAEHSAAVASVKEALKRATSVQKRMWELKTAALKEIESICKSPTGD